MPRYNGEPTKGELRLKRQQERFAANMSKLTPEELSKAKIVDGEVRLPRPPAASRKATEPPIDPIKAEADALIEQGKLIEPGKITPNEQLREEMIQMARSLKDKADAEPDVTRRAHLMALSADVYRSAISTGMKLEAPKEEPPQKYQIVVQRREVTAEERAAYEEGQWRLKQQFASEIPPEIRALSAKPERGTRDDTGPIGDTFGGWEQPPPPPPTIPLRRLSALATDELDRARWIQMGALGFRITTGDGEELDADDMKVARYVRQRTMERNA